MNTIEFLRIPQSMMPDKVCLVHEGKRFTYTQLMDRVGRLATALSKLGVGKGDKIAILQTNCNQYVESYYAASLLGCPFVPLNYRAKRDELTYMLNNSEASVLLFGERYASMGKDIQLDIPALKHFISIDGPIEHALNYEDLIASTEDESTAQEAEVDDSDLNMLMYTSGTTALPKGVMLTYGGFTEMVFNSVEPAFDEESGGANLLAAPLYHIAGASAMMTGPYGGRTLVIPKQFDPTEWLQLVQKEKVTHAFLVPTMLKQVIDHPDFAKYDLSSLQMVSYGGAPMPVPVIRRAIERFPEGIGFMNAFGQTETTSTVTLLGPDDHRLEGTLEEIEAKIRRLASIGRPLGDVRVEILDDEGKPVPAGTVGEIAIGASRVMSGYWKREEDTAKTLVDGWIRTRDMGWLDEDGYLFLAGRKSDMIIRGGENIAPEQIEGVLHVHPDIDEAAVIGLPDEEWGEKVICVVVARQGSNPSENEIIMFCKTRMASFKAPETVKFVEALPRNPMGKILKAALRDEYKS
ncbi:MAG: long-chain fatty acid--CoA ligase [Dehalococcoidia bacterium]|nr:long-chain fatty acid--CoA ligase [Dehalococcoidia bacterium]